MLRHTVLAAGSVVAMTAEAGVTVVNHSSRPVYATTIELPAGLVARQAGLEAGSPVEAVTADGAVIPFHPATRNGEPVLRAFLGMKGHARQDLSLRQAEGWESADAVTVAGYDGATKSAKLSNGLLTLEFQNDRWSLAYVNRADDRDAILLEDGQMDYWLDAERHGRLMGMAKDKLAAMGLLPSSSAGVVDGRALVGPDGAATLVLTRAFDGMGSNVVWEETFTLRPGEPVLLYSSRWTCKDEQKRYVAYVGLGGGLHALYGNLLRGKLRFKYENPGEGDLLAGVSQATKTSNPSESSRVLLSGENNSFTRIAWRDERCWVGVDSDLGCGIGVSTLKEITREIPGNSVWSFANSGMFIRLLDDRQENQPYVFSRDEPLELGFAFVATCGDVGIWNQTRNLFRAVTRDENPVFNEACAVYMDGQPLQHGEANRTDVTPGNDGPFIVVDGRRIAALEVDFKRAYQLAVKADGPLSIVVTPEGNDGEPVEIVTLDRAGERVVDFTGVTGWLGTRRTFTLEIRAGAETTLERLAFEPAAFPAPQLNVPSDGLSMTDIAAYFRWHQVKGALDYELQFSRSADFDSPVTKVVRSEVKKPHFIPVDRELPAPGEWFWRVRALEPASPGQWSEVRSFTVNNDRSPKPVAFTISPTHPLFTMEGCRVPDWSRFTNTIPVDIRSNVAINTSIYGTEDHLAYFKPLHDMGQPVFVSTHHPSPMSHWLPLSMVEELFQTYPNIIGALSGETLSTLYVDTDTPYAVRLLMLCAKYGRIFYNADGTYPGENKWQTLYQKRGAVLDQYKDHIIFAQKNNILHRQFVSQSSVLGLYLANDLLAQGAWEDGGWYWQQTGFRELGEVKGQRGGDVTTMPRIFWTLNFAMGLGRGCSVFSFEGQVGTTPVPLGWKLADHPDLPDTATGPYRNPAAFWTTDGEFTPAFNRFCLPFIRAVLNHQLVPDKDEVRANVKLAVYNDGVPKADEGDQYYFEWEALYRGTYGFRDFGVIPGTLMEYFPNTGRYYYFPVLPQGRRDLGPEIELLPLSKLMDADEVNERFDAAYPAWYEGDALVNIVGHTLTVLNSNENFDERQRYSIPMVNRGNLLNIAGTVETHSYVLGKLGNPSLWLQANTEYPERDTQIVLTCMARPEVVVTPASAAKVNRWDDAAGTLTLILSHADGAVEVEVSP